jgi:hypothetical protein
MIQSILAVGAMILIGIGAVSMNRGFDSNESVMNNSKIGIMAVSLASSKIEQAIGKSFDEVTVDSLILSTTGLTPAVSLGLDAGESFAACNDVDDFNRITMYDTIDGGGAKNRIPFRTTCSVYYVDPASPDVARFSPTWHKKIVVTVTSPAMIDTIREEYIYSYFKFQ